ncbi:hypothetical protein KAR91_61785 [Candidatus Pacearchaeota archaeon]|nr:hypothetical protein [Candidatus Pacearchaeota archaeon]
MKLFRIWYYCLTKKRTFPRSVRFWWQRRTRGWDDSDTWSLDDSLTTWLLPRLKRFKEVNNAYPSRITDEHEWDAILNRMIESLEWYSNHHYGEGYDGDYKKWQQDFSHTMSGLRLITKYWRELWW